MFHLSNRLILLYTATLTTLFVVITTLVTGWGAVAYLDTLFGVYLFLTVIACLYGVIAGPLTRNIKLMILSFSTLLIIEIIFLFATTMFVQKYWLRGTDGGPSGASANCLFWSGAIEVYDDSDKKSIDDLVCVGLNTPNLVATRFDPRANGYGDPNISYVVAYGTMAGVIALLNYKIFVEIKRKRHKK